MWESQNFPLVIWKDVLNDKKFKWITRWALQKGF